MVVSYLCDQGIAMSFSEDSGLICLCPFCCITQVEAERKKRAAILESEGVREADVNVAEGRRQARILASEAEKQEQINRAEGEANALLAMSKARAQGLEIVAQSLMNEVRYKKCMEKYLDDRLDWSFVIPFPLGFAYLYLTNRASEALLDVNFRLGATVFNRSWRNLADLYLTQNSFSISGNK